MRLTTENGDVPDVTTAEVERTLGRDVFVSFAVLSADEDNFIQTTDDWQGGWVLEYRDGATGRLFRTTGPVTLDDVCDAFLSYLSGGDEWRQLTWEEFHL
jgi:hypothetical protein